MKCFEFISSEVGPTMNTSHRLASFPPGARLRFHPLSIQVPSFSLKSHIPVHGIPLLHMQITPNTGRERSSRTLQCSYAA